MKNLKDFSRFTAKMIDGKIKPYSIETWLPLFPGFYCTWLESDIAEESELNYINEQREKKNLPPVKWDDLIFDYKDYEKRVARAFIDAIEARLMELKVVWLIKFQEVVSPKYYNFSNDSVNCEIEMKPGNAENLYKYLHDNRDAFNTYLKDNYTSYDGFLSRYPNNFVGWMEDTEDFTNFEIDKHHLGAILQFVLLNEDVKTEDIYDEICEATGYIGAINYCELTEGEA